MNTNTRTNPRTKLGWSRPFFALGAILACISLGALTLRAVAPAAGTSIGNQASADYTDSTGTARNATSNLVQTIVQAVYSHTLVDDRTAIRTPGSQVDYSHTLTNTGNASDTYTLTAAQATGDSADYTSIKIYLDADGNGIPDNTTDLTGTTVTLVSGGTFKYVVEGLIPGSVTSGNTVKLTTTATSSVTGGSVAHTNTDTVTITTNGVITVTKSISSPSGPSPSASAITYTLTYTNTGNTAATNLTVTDTIPAGMTYQAGTALWSVTGATALTDATGDTQGSSPTIAYDFTSGKVTALISQVAVGESRTITFQVKVNSSVTPGTINNVAQWTYDPDGAGPATTTSTETTNTVPYTVTQTVGVAYGSSDPSVNGETDKTVASATPGQTISWTNTVKNTGTGSDSFDITYAAGNFPAGTTFQLLKPDGVTPLIDTNGNNTPDTGTLAPGGTYDVVVKATIPTGATNAGAPFLVTLTASSFVNPTATQGTNTVKDQLTAITPLTVDLTNNTSGASNTAPGYGAGPEASAVITNTTAPTVTTTFTLVAYNPNASADSYSLGVSTDSTFATTVLPSGWTVVFKNNSGGVITSTGSVPAVGSVTYTAEVTAPAGTAPTTYDLYFRVLSPATSVKDVLHDAVTISTVRNITVSPNNTGQSGPGGTVIYQHTITNNGNVTEGNTVGSNVSLGLTDSLPGWTSTVYWDANGNGVIDAGEVVVTNLNFLSGGTAGLAPGESVQLLVKVSVPPGASSPQSDTTTLTATTANAGYTTTVPGAVSVTDTTSVVAGNLQLVKTQALDANCDGVADGPFTQSQITTGAIPGACVIYKIVVTNVGTDTATGIIVHDTTPSSTTYNSTAGTATVTGGSVNTIGAGAPTTGNAGSFDFNVGNLAPNGTATITFGVKINQ